MNNEPLTSTDQLRTSMENLTLNELCFDEDIFYDQPCFWGSRYGSHAVYCHNDQGPMKCRMGCSTGCDLFKPNEEVV